MIYALLVVEFILVGLALYIIGTMLIFLINWKNMLPFVPTSRRVAKRMVKELNLKEGDRVVDIGSGMGALVFQAARMGADSTGIEHSKLLIAVSKIREFFFRKKKNIRFLRRDAFKMTFEDYNKIIGWWIPNFIKKLQPKLERELRPGARVVSYMFRFFPSIYFKETIITQKKEVIYVYDKVK